MPPLAYWIWPSFKGIQYTLQEYDLITFNNVSRVDPPAVTDRRPVGHGWLYITSVVLTARTWVFCEYDLDDLLFYLFVFTTNSRGCVWYFALLTQIFLKLWYDVSVINDSPLTADIVKCLHDSSFFNVTDMTHTSSLSICISRYDTFVLTTWGD